MNGTLTIIDDPINANPPSMQLALDTLAETPGQRRLAVLGLMAELGEDASRYHQDIGTYARRRAEIVIGVGDLARHYRPDRWFADSGECAGHLDEIVRPGDCLLVKGSAAAAMRKITEALQDLADRRPGG